MLRHRIISGIAFGVGLVMAVSYLPPVGTLLVLLILSSVAQLEFYTLLAKAGIPVMKRVGLLCGGVLICATVWASGRESVGLAEAGVWDQFVLLAIVIILFVCQFVRRKEGNPITSIACTLLGVIYVPYLFNFFSRLTYGWDSAMSGTQVGETGRLLVLYGVVVVKSTDVGAYAVGRLIGRHKFFPRISPKKTWEGFVGGVAVAVLASFIFIRVTDGQLGKLTVGPLDALVLGVLLSLSGVIGDLFESMLKRAADAKDSGVVIPGMGGLLDVLDSLLFSMPVLYFYAHLFMS
jgi:phosphatidate cytidylyltransferase